MARLLYTVSDLVAAVRSLLDESNQDSVSTELDILPSLNRGLTFGYDILARKYPEPILTHETLTLSGGTQEYDIPEGYFEDRLLKVEIEIPSGSSATYREVTRISYRDISRFETTAPSAVPTAYVILGRKIRLLGSPSGIYSARIWGLREPEALVLPQGRVTHISIGSRYVVVDEIGADISTESDQLESYVNLVDGQTGEIRATLQIANLVDNKATFRSVPLRSTVLGRTVVGEIPTTVQQDDYLCAVSGSCVPSSSVALSNFLIEFSVAEMMGKLGEDRTGEEQILDKFEKQLERSWVGRENKMRVQSRSSPWRSVRSGWISGR